MAPKQWDLMSYILLCFSSYSENTSKFCNLLNKILFLCQTFIDFIYKSALSALHIFINMLIVMIYGYQ